MTDKILAYSIIGGFDDGTVMIRDAFDKICISSDIEEILEFLLYGCTASVPSSALRVLWELDRDLDYIISLLPGSIKKNLTSKQHTAFLNSYKLYYIRGKRFDIRKCQEEASFFSLQQYFPKDAEPDNVYDLQKKADELKTMLSEIGIAFFTGLSSPVAIAEKSGLLKRYLGDIPTIFDAPDDTLEGFEMALQCSPREWVSNYQIGQWRQGELGCADIASAYPAAASQLIDLRDCSFKRFTAMDYEAYNGVLVGEFTVYPDSPYSFCSPFLGDRGDGVLVNFVGTQKNYYCLLDEVRALNKYKLGEFHLDHGWFIYPPKDIQLRFPFRNIMTQFYQYRSISPLASSFFKRIMVGIIGKLLETRKNQDGSTGSYGDLYNPLIHSMITTSTRLKVFDFLVQHNVTPQNLVFVGLDEVKLVGQIPLPEKVGMGEWRSKGSQPTVVLSPGAVITPDRDYKGIGYSELMEQICKRPAAWKYGNNGGIDLRELAKNQTRVFPKLPKTGQDLLRSNYLSSPVSI